MHGQLCTWMAGLIMTGMRTEMRSANECSLNACGAGYVAKFCTGGLASRRQRRQLLVDCRLLSPYFHRAETSRSRPHEDMAARQDDAA